jgi:hypothetical protein
MNNSNDDINGKFELKYGADTNITAMKAISEAHFISSIVKLSKVFEQFPEVQGDEVVKNHPVQQTIRENLWKIIESCAKVAWRR